MWLERGSHQRILISARFHHAEKLCISSQSLLIFLLWYTFVGQLWRGADKPVIEIPSATDGHGWMKDGDNNVMPVGFEGDCLLNILINDDDLPDNEESDNDVHEDDETAIDETDYSGDDY